MTYKQARKALFEGLRAKGWTVITFNTSTMRDMVEPYCDVPGTKYRLWFTTQAVHYGLNRPAARSTFLDIRRLSVDEFIKQVHWWIDNIKE